MSTATKSRPKREKRLPGESSSAYEERINRGKRTVRTGPHGKELPAIRQGTAAAITKALKMVPENGRVPEGEGVVAMEITPELAGDLLAKNINNRKLRDPRVMRIAKDITDGRWADLNGETIKLSHNGQVLDGQHRLAAVLVANKSIWTYVAFGVRDDAFHTIDTGLKRSGADTLFVAGEEGAQGLAKTLNAMWRYLSDGTFRYRSNPTNEQLLQVLEATPGLRESAEVAKRVNKRVRGLPIGVAAVLHYLFSEIDAEDASYFFETLRTGTGLGADDPIYHLRERLVPAKPLAGQTFNYQHEAAVVVIKAWNAYRRGLPLTNKSLRYWEDEKLPEIA